MRVVCRVSLILMFSCFGSRRIPPAPVYGNAPRRVQINLHLGRVAPHLIQLRCGNAEFARGKSRWPRRARDIPSTHSQKSFPLRLLPLMEKSNEHAQHPCSKLEWDFRTTITIRLQVSMLLAYFVS